jgi:hypothetical protein
MFGMNARPRREESGAALVWAIAVMVIGLLVVVAMSMSSVGQQRDLRARSDKVIATPIVQGAVTKLRLGLESGTIAEWDRYMPTSADYLSITGAPAVNGAPGPTGSAVRTVSLTPPTQASTLKDMPAPPNVAVREPSTIPGRYGFWQIFRVDAPKYSWPKEQGNLRYWLRTWTGNATGGATSEVRYWRVDLRPGRFVDFQMLIDGPIQFADGDVINWPIHTNGFRDELPLSKPPAAQTRVWANNGSVTCTSKAIITSAQGNIQLPNCTKQESTGEYINLLRTEDMFDRVRRGCQLNAPHVWCRFQTRDGADLQSFGGMVSSGVANEIDLRGYHVRLAGNKIEVGHFDVNPLNESVSTNVLWTFNTSADNPWTLYFADSVTVEGTTSGRVTIIARRPVQTTSMAIDGSSNGAANIYVIGDVQHTGQGSSVGLVAQGGLLLSAMKKNGGNIPCVSRIEAAMIGVTGTIALDPRYLTVLDQAYNELKCSNQLRLDGALAAHRSPILYWEWNSGKSFGYPNRVYEFDENLRKAPPPEFPNASPWQAVQIKPANIDCLVNGGGAACE